VDTWFTNGLFTTSGCCLKDLVRNNLFSGGFI
jgi:hypothetical protein